MSNRDTQTDITYDSRGKWEVCIKLEEIIACPMVDAQSLHNKMATIQEKILKVYYAIQA